MNGHVRWTDVSKYIHKHTRTVCTNDHIHFSYPSKYVCFIITIPFASEMFGGLESDLVALTELRTHSQINKKDINFESISIAKETNGNTVLNKL